MPGTGDTVMDKVVPVSQAFVSQPRWSPGSSAGKESTCNAGDPGSIPGLRSSPGKGNGYPLQYSCLENSMGKGAYRATVHVVTKSQTRLSHFHFQYKIKPQ